MNGRQGGFGSTLLMGLAAAGTTWAAMVSWNGLTTSDADYLGPLVVAGLAVAVSGAAGRWGRVPGPLLVLGQLVLAAVVLTYLLTGMPVPVGGAWHELVADFTSAVESARTYEAPVPVGVPGIHPLLVAAGLAAMVIIDAIACTARRVPLAGLPLLALYSVPISLVGGGVSAGVFVLTAVGFLSMLFLHQDEQVTRWGRAVEQDAAAGSIGSFGVRTGSARANAGAIGSVATGLAVVVPLVIPTLDLDLLDIGPGAGGDSDVKIENPTADLLRDINRGADIGLVRVTTDDPDPDYLRITALTRFTGEEWTPGDRDSPSDHVADGEMPPSAGVSVSLDRVEYAYQVVIDDDFKSDWLPTQFPVSSITAEGDWRYDESTMDFFAWEEGVDTAGLEYSMTAVEHDLRGADLAAAPASVADVPPAYRENPEGLPDIVRSTALRETGDAETRFDKAVALQSFFRRNFEYSLDDGPGGSGADQLATFLTPGPGGRVGYCEQFAAAMAVLAREIGIPARVAVGFLEPQPLGGGTWEYSAHDLHAWPELFFDGYGWVRFEPTPDSRAGAAPSYTRGRGGGTDAPTELPSASASEEDPQAPTSERPSAEAQPAGAEGGDRGSSSLPWARVGLGAGGGLALALLVLVPRLARRQVRQRRLTEGPEAAWEELRATVTDLQLRWPAGRSPRETRDWLVHRFGAPSDERTSERPARGPTTNPAAVAALDRIVAELELLRYSRHGGVAGQSWREDVETCIAALEAGVSPRVRRRAGWLPASVLSRQARSRSRAARNSEADAALTPGGAVVEHVG